MFKIPKSQILTMIDYYEKKQKITTSSIELAIIKDTIVLLKQALPTPPRTYYAEGDYRIVCPNEECCEGWGITVYPDESYCSECGQAIDWEK